MIATKFLDTKKELDIFEKEKILLCQEFDNNINNNDTSQYRLSCCMAAIYYEYKKIMVSPALKQWKPKLKAQTPDGKVEMLLKYINKNFNMMEIQHIARSLGLIGENGLKKDTKSVLAAIPKIEEIAKPVLDEINQFRASLKEKFLGHNIEFKHISSVDIRGGKINPSRELENQPQNELMTGVFATSSYVGMNLYACRAAADGNMIVNKEGITFPINPSPFASMEEQKDSSRIKLSKPVYAYSLPAERI